MAIQGIQIPMYTKHTVFVFFLFFNVFLYFYMKIKINKTENNKQKHIEQSKA